VKKLEDKTYMAIAPARLFSGGERMERLPLPVDFSLVGSL
jgi:hypothetical protein